MLDEMERALHDSLCVIKRTLESGKVVPGGGAVEAALSIYLENFATTLVCAFVFAFFASQVSLSLILLIG
jgi:chaperonin GroEL (HSP60 family)